MTPPTLTLPQISEYIKSMKRRQTNPRGGGGGGLAAASAATTTLVYFSLFVSLFALFLIGFLFTTYSPLVILGGNSASPPATLDVQQEIPCMTDRPQTLENPYVPPVKKTDVYLPPIQTRLPPISLNLPRAPCVINDYSQMGILVRQGTDMILPLMGRKLYGRRDKFQYYTISNTGNVNTKLPVRFKGQNGMSEYGCDEIFSRDMVYVEGYKDVFEATIYENNSYVYDSLVV
jgi:hypothetical protein